MTKPQYINAIMNNLPSAYTPESAVFQRVVRGLLKLTIDELDGLLAITMSRRG